MSAIERIERLTIEEFVRLYEQEGPFELVNGERKPLMPPVALHGVTVRSLLILLYSFCRTHRLGQVFNEMPFVLVYSSHWVKGSRSPDVLFFSQERWEQYIHEVPDWQGKPFILIPDLAVEVVSPNDLYSDIQDKVVGYLADGVRLVWVVDPERQRVEVYEGERHLALRGNDTLTGGDIIPGLTLKLEEIFNFEG